MSALLCNYSVKYRKWVVANRKLFVQKIKLSILDILYFATKKKVGNKENEETEYFFLDEYFRKIDTLP